MRIWGELKNEHKEKALGIWAKDSESLSKSGRGTVDANLKYKFGNRHFWAEGYYVSTVGLNEATIRKYI